MSRHCTNRQRISIDVLFFLLKSRWLTTVYNIYSLDDHFNHAISGVGKILHCISSFKVAYNSFSTCILIDHFHHDISSVGKILHCISRYHAVSGNAKILE